jgi:type III secretion system HrpB7-like protein
VAHADPRLHALRRSVERRKRLDSVLRERLAALRAEHARIEAQCAAKRDEVAGEDERLRECQQRTADLMGGERAFSPTELSARLRHMETVAGRLRALQAELAAVEQALQAKAEEILASARAVANNLGRIERCSDRIKTLEHRANAAASDAVDEEAEEIALARMRAATRQTP